VWLTISLLALLAVASFAIVLLLLLRTRDGTVARGRFERMFKIGRLSAHVSTSWLGARLRRRFASVERRRRIDDAQRRAMAARVAETMGNMKGAFMKLGQMLSFVSDDVPEELRVALASLQAEAPPMEFGLLRDVAERELGMPLERAFARFDEKPLASASIGQVHRAMLPSGEEVVVKVQYPGIADAIQSDLDNAAMLYALMAPFYPGVDGKQVVDELRARIGEELDYRHEADHQRLFAAAYDGHPFIRVPRVIDGYSTARVLTSEFVDGRRFADILNLGSKERARYGEIVYRFVFGTIARHGLFNADPHPGNYIFDRDGRVAFLDYGCVKRFPPAMLDDWRGLVRSHLVGQREEFVRRLAALGFIASPDGWDAALLYDYFGYFYEPFHEDREFTFDKAYNRRSFGVVFKPQGRFAPLAKRLNMPRHFVFVNRIQWGVHSILAQLGACGNWHRIHGEIMFEGPPATELGVLEAEYRARRMKSAS
jgi:predicted unusual protein kinase regulating ubiquinone biosynthesis (AarF/ABC1/UbiB family)